MCLYGRVHICVRVSVLGGWKEEALLQTSSVPGPWRGHSEATVWAPPGAVAQKKVTWDPARLTEVVRALAVVGGHTRKPRGVT